MGLNAQTIRTPNIPQFLKQLIHGLNIRWSNQTHISYNIDKMLLLLYHWISSYMTRIDLR